MSYTIESGDIDRLEKISPEDSVQITHADGSGAFVSSPKSAFAQMRMQRALEEGGTIEVLTEDEYRDEFERVLENTPDEQSEG